MSEVKKVGPLDDEREEQLNQLISLRFKHILEEVEQKYKSSLDHHIDINSTMMNIYEDMISATNELINQTHVRHEMKIQRLEKETKKKDEMNLIMHQVLIKLF